MNTYSKKTFRLLGIASIVLALTIGFSCKKDEADPNPSNNNPNGGGEGNSLIASADLNFVDLGKAFDFKCYKLDANVDNITIHNDTLQMIFGNNQTAAGDTVVLQIIISNVNGFNAGQTYSVSDNSYNGMVVFSVYAENAPELGYTAVNDVGNPYSTSGELKITSKSGNHIKGTFHFKGYTFPNPLNPGEPQKEIIVTNGKIDCDYVVK